jgi:hypothetical protein
MLVKLILEILIETRVERPEARLSVGRKLLYRATQVGELFRNPVVQTVCTPEGYHLYLARPLVCFNALHLNQALARIPGDARAVYLHVTDLVTMIDHTTTSTLIDFAEEFKRGGRGIVEILGLDHLRPRSHDRACMRISPPIAAQERVEALQAMARLSLTSEVNPAAVDRVLELAHLSLVSPGRTTAEALEHPVTVFLVRTARRLAAGMTKVLEWLRKAFEQAEPIPARDLCWYGLSRSDPRYDQYGCELGLLSLTRTERVPDARSQAGTSELKLI